MAFDSKFSLVRVKPRGDANEHKLETMVGLVIWEPSELVGWREH